MLQVFISIQKMFVQEKKGKNLYFGMFLLAYKGFKKSQKAIEMKNLSFSFSKHHNRNMLESQTLKIVSAIIFFPNRLTRCLALRLEDSPIYRDGFDDRTENGHFPQNTILVPLMRIPRS